MLRLSRLKKNSGFLLIEVLVSVVVITVGLIYIVHSFSVSTRAIGTSRDYIKALTLLEEKLWELEAAGEVEEGEDEDYFGDERVFAWELEAETEDEPPVNKTRLTVLWPERKRKQKISVTTYLWDRDD